MTKLQFKCTLKSDIIINQKSATEGVNSTLDFIPGSNFLGIVAAHLYKKYGSCKRTLDIFHNGNIVRFGDAHPASGNIRTLKVPAAIFYPKLKSVDEESYVMHHTDNNGPKIKRLQLKQCRSGFFAFNEDENTATEIKPQTSYALKSAHDKNNRTSMNSQMYGYQSLAKDTEMFFEVEVECDEYADEVKDALCGIKHVGRSRSAQYGLVEITETSFDTIESPSSAKGYIEVYADSRLIFIDDSTGMPTFNIKPEHLGIDAKHICWEKSQIRTFQYSPWNYQRQCYDTDRCGIEKGSVIIIEDGTWNGENTVGSYRNEGFGKIIVNPDFLKANQDGTAKYKFITKKPDSKNKRPDVKKIDAGDDDLLQFLVKKADDEATLKNIYDAVNKAVGGDFGKLFKGKQFASQWGTIRSMASQNATEPIEHRLFGGEQITDEDAYLTHGVAKDKWADFNRKGKLQKFLEAFKDEHIKRLALINLASEMAKICRKKEDGKND